MQGLMARQPLSRRRHLRVGAGVVAMASSWADAGLGLAGEVGGRESARYQRRSEIKPSRLLDLPFLPE